MKAQESFKHDPEVQALLATDAAGEGINLQRAHLMVNYDLPWNPNRIEQRFGRIHRIGQTEVCHLWNLVAEETREGEVYRTLLEKLEQARTSLGGQVFDVLGKLQFEGRSLRDLLIEAVRYGERPEVRARLTQVVAHAFDRSHIQDLLEERTLAHDAMDASRVYRIREEMERAEARRLQPHYIESFFLEAFQRLGGTTKQREPRRYEVTHVPAPVRNRDRLIGIGEPVLPRYERIAFEKSRCTPRPTARCIRVPRPPVARRRHRSHTGARPLGYDIESRVPGTGRLRFLEVKGRDSDADTITVTKNEILYSLNKPEDFILAIVAFDGDDHRVHYLRQPFQREPDFGVTSVNYNFAELLARALQPR